MDLSKNLKDLQSLLELMRRNDLAELELEEEGQRIRLRKTEPHVTAAPMSIAAPAVLDGRSALPGAPAVPTAGGAPATAAAPGGEEATDGLHVVNSPLVGTFYRSSSPEKDPFVQEGDRVEADAVLCIIEAMKVMNEIEAGTAGVVREILVKNGEPVEFGQPLFKMDAD